MHTPGPWEIRHEFNVFGGTRLVAGTGGHSSNQCPFDVDAENRANAVLIAAAPDLLEALELIASRAGGCQLQPHDPASGEPVPEFVAVTEIREWALAAIAKAVGR